MRKLPYADRNSGLWLLLSQARHAMFNLRQRELAKLRISNIEAGVLAIVDALEPSEATPSNISRFFVRQRHTVSQLLTRMEKKGLVARRKDITPRNLVRIELTEEGRRLSARVNERKAIDEVMSGLSEEDFACLESALRRLRDRALEKMNIEHSLLDELLP